jgi:hypothetical protein
MKQFSLVPQILLTALSAQLIIEMSIEIILPPAQIHMRTYLCIYNVFNMAYRKKIMFAF